MSYTAKNRRAINWYARRDNLVVQPSGYPMITFKRLGDSVTITQSLQNIMDWYGNYLNAERRRRYKEAKQ